jgi:hypothetical protein
MRGEVLGNVSKGPQATGTAVDQAQLQAELFGNLKGFVGLLGDVPQGALTDLQG